MISIGSIIFAFIAGVLSSLSPCVLPILPIVLGASVAAHRFGPVALASGLALSFTAIGLLVATFGFAIGIDGGIFRMIGALLLLIFGLVLVAPALQLRVAVIAGPASNWIEQRFGGFSTTGLSGQFALGLLFGAVWTPCVGPTLGAAALLAAKGQNLSHVFLVMLVFGFGAALPLLAFGTLSRAAFIRWRGVIAGSSKRGKLILGGIMLVFGVLILTGLNQTIEAYLVTHTPDWLLQLTTRY